MSYRVIVASKLRDFFFKLVYFSATNIEIQQVEIVVQHNRGKIWSLSFFLAHKFVDIGDLCWNNAIET